ncbi:hypothetical protein ACGFIY_21065 [Micromonospora chersina]|uniref:hypothetical protein n=1 Tax=Micromonospora chersina TaxID=47854 RepID=UPI00371486BC
MNGAHATFTITVPWWAYGAFCAGVLGLIAAGYVAGRLDRRDARQAAAVEQRFAPTLDRWRTVDQKPRHAAPEWPTNPVEPRWAATVEAWGQPRPAAGYPRPPALTAEPHPRAAQPSVGRAEVPGEPLTWFEEIGAIRAALGHVRYAADAEETGYIPVVRA